MRLPLEQKGLAPGHRPPPASHLCRDHGGQLVPELAIDVGRDDAAPERAAEERRVLAARHERPRRPARRPGDPPPVVPRPLPPPPLPPARPHAPHHPLPLPPP